MGFRENLPQALVKEFAGLRNQTRFVCFFLKGASVPFVLCSSCVVVLSFGPLIQADVFSRWTLRPLVALTKSFVDSTTIEGHKPRVVHLLLVLKSTLKGQPNSRLTFVPAIRRLASSAAGSVGISRPLVCFFLPQLRPDNTFGLDKYSKSVILIKNAAVNISFWPKSLFLVQR